MYKRQVLDFDGSADFRDETGTRLGGNFIFLAVDVIIVRQLIGGAGLSLPDGVIFWSGVEAVSYTHLDVYKRQDVFWLDTETRPEPHPSNISK